MKRPLETLSTMTSRPSLGFDLLRVCLGGALLVRGALFVTRPQRLYALVEGGGGWSVPPFVAHYVSAAHLCGGLLLALGLATRLTALVQVPILVAAVFVVHWDEGLLAAGQSLELSVLVLAMLVAYSIFGAGALSLDHVLSQRTGAPGSRAPEPSGAGSRRRAG